MRTVRWGILGPGSIASRFAGGIAAAQNAEIYAIASRSIDRAEAFQKRFGGEKLYTDYEALIEDPEVDVVYVATPHVFHLECAKLCLTHKKPVLCEKPIAVNAGQVGEMIDCARENRTFLMEAMWSRFFPIMAKVREILKGGAIGEVRMVQADFGFRCGWNPESRLLDPELAGGGLLDVGIYPMSLFSMLLGKPVDVQGQAHIGETGVDEQAAWICRYENGALAIGASAVRTNTPQIATILGTDGRIVIDSPWWCPKRMTLSVNGREPQVFEMPFSGPGFEFEVEAVGRAVLDGLEEHPLMPLDESLEIARSMDALRRQWGLSYPCETKANG